MALQNEYDPRMQEEDGIGAELAGLAALGATMSPMGRPLRQALGVGVNKANSSIADGAIGRALSPVGEALGDVGSGLADAGGTLVKGYGRGFPELAQRAYKANAPGAYTAPDTLKEAFSMDATKKNWDDLLKMFGAAGTATATAAKSTRKGKAGKKAKAGKSGYGEELSTANMLDDKDFAEFANSTLAKELDMNELMDIGNLYFRSKRDGEPIPMATAARMVLAPE